MVVPHPESKSLGATQAPPRARELYLILFPREFKERIEGILDAIGGSGYPEGPNLVGSGSHGVPPPGQDNRIVIGPVPKFTPKARKPRAR